MPSIGATEDFGRHVIVSWLRMAVVETAGGNINYIVALEGQ